MAERQITEASSEYDSLHSFLDDQINRFNTATTGIAWGGPIAFCIRDEQGTIGAGIAGSMWGGTAHINVLWVREEWRSLSYGTRLLAAAETYAAEHGCFQVFLETHSFQAPDFYHKYGYSVFGVLDDYPPGEKQYYLRKALPRPVRG